MTNNRLSQLPKRVRVLGDIPLPKRTKTMRISATENPATDGPWLLKDRTELYYNGLLVSSRLLVWPPDPALVALAEQASVLPGKIRRIEGNIFALGVGDGSFKFFVPWPTSLNRELHSDDNPGKRP